MKIRNLFVLHTIVFILVGLAIILIPTLIPEITGGLLTEHEGIQLSRLLGITVLCLGVLTWFTRDTKPSTALSSIVLTLALWHGLDSINMIVGIVQESKAVIAWAFPLIHGCFSVAFLTCLPKAKGQV